MKKILDCPMCDGNANLASQKKVRTFRKEEFEIYEYFYQCDNCHEEFTTKETDEVNVAQVHNQYREKYKIPLPEQLTLTKDMYKITSATFSKIIGLGINQFLTYEKGEVPSESNGNLLSLSVEAKEVLKLLERRKEKFSLNGYNKIKKNIEEIIETTDNNWLSLKNMFFQQNIFPSRFNGYSTPSFDKFANMVLFFLDNAPYKTRLNKLLFYSDFSFFKYFGKSISGVEYAAIPNGPVPEKYDLKFSLLTHENIISTELCVINNEEVEKFVPTTDLNLSIFNQNELLMMQETLTHFRYRKTKDIINISHEEEGWKDNISSKSLISYLDYAPILKEI